MLTLKLQNGSWEIKININFNQLVHPGFSKLGKAIETSNRAVAETLEKTVFVVGSGSPERRIASGVVHVLFGITIGLKDVLGQISRRISMFSDPKMNSVFSRLRKLCTPYWELTWSELTTKTCFLNVSATVPFEVSMALPNFEKPG